MTPNKYLWRMDERRESLTGIARTWADFNAEMEIVNVRPTPEIVEMVADDCRRIIADLESRPQTPSVADALEVKRNQLKELERMLNKLPRPVKAGERRAIMMGLTNEVVLKMLQNRGIDIKSLDRDGVLAWGDDCWERYNDGGSAPSAPFELEPFGGSVTYVSGTGNTIIVIPGRRWGGRAECKIYSAVDEPEHAEALSAEIDPLTTEIQNAHSKLVPAGEPLELRGITLIPLRLEYADNCHPLSYRHDGEKEG